MNFRCHCFSRINASGLSSELQRLTADVCTSALPGVDFPFIATRIKIPHKNAFECRCSAVLVQFSHDARSRKLFTSERVHFQVSQSEPSVLVTLSIEHINRSQNSAAASVYPLQTLSRVTIFCATALCLSLILFPLHHWAFSPNKDRLEQDLTKGGSTVRKFRMKMYVMKNKKLRISGNFCTVQIYSTAVWGDVSRMRKQK